MHDSGAVEPGLGHFSLIHALTLLTLNPTSNGSLSVSFNNKNRCDVRQNSMEENAALARIGHLSGSSLEADSIYCLLQGKPTVDENAVQVH